MAGGVGLDVKPGDEVGDLRFGEIGLRHTLVGPSVAQDWSDKDALLVVENYKGTDQIGRARPASGGGAVASAAIGGVEFAAAVDSRGVFFGACDGSGKGSGLIARPPAGGSGGSGFLGDERDGWRQKQQRKQ